MMGEAETPKYIRYSTVTGFFQQDDPATDASTFDYTATNFGLINREYSTDAEYDPDRKKTQWQRFEFQVYRLNEESGPQVQYKVLYMGRHGEGYHNAAESYYGTPAWDCYWSTKDGNDTVTWADAHLTPAGILQALKANTFWAQMISTQKIPTPESYYASPLTRCLQTAFHTFSNLSLPADRPFIPQIKELFREEIGVHTCDRRSSKSYIQQHYPTCTFEDGFAEEDPLWTPDVRETADAQDARTKTVLDDVFGNDTNTYISISSHSGEIASILRVIGHRTFSLGTGQVIPVLVRAETVDGTAPSSSIAPSSTVSTCTAPPATSTL
ncbi:hypothetical protein M430DRAFT_46334 [Amorphotheca resinae ATCC 22711]|uniref:Phosphoglycerate mutase family protein n=1 Tax=Amorphotheca resinae ATCC 22711 TaxID=857342 RepID=A0A2T3BCV0_AMORE|nr:hypothetical protein M430DRAFT_46334 [Amorphotheca resinae ATCC 22711]PSS27231.1 hypothetical protein M430DRAFT_46334 [Amorphotheca resinae ATCC 22711]